QTCLPTFPPMHQSRLQGPLSPRTASLQLTTARDNDGYEFLRPFRWRIRQGRPPRAILRRDQFDSWLASESKRNSKITKAAIIAIVTSLTSRLKSAIQRHPAIHEQLCALDVIRLVACQPSRDAPNLFRLADTLVWNQLEQFVVMLGRVPGLHVNRCANCARGNRVHTNS